MAENHTINNLMTTSMEKIRELVDVNTIIGEPITSPDGTIIIPVSKVSFGFVSGGSDLPTQAPKDVFAGGSGAGITIKPVAFIVVQRDGEVKMLELGASGGGALEGIINGAPELIAKVKEMFGKKGDSEEAEAEKEEK
ncbi:MAG: GerW family sporulation protein [Ruminiclostridium sp.]|nr:GerW family sporulation protein [Ruminiclostridium sp.]MBQ8931184.1 GerW family sporulation protein [Ruminiclostridium sp.]